jgi:acetylornithine/succinyldiaminopimelate/putrescine aminotransferase
MSQFHSTTFQPNTVSCLHFLRCVEAADPEFFARHQAVLDRIEHDVAFRFQIFERLYSQPLARLTSRAGFATDPIHAAGHSITVSGRRIFDGVAGIACSIRGHNPPDYVGELAGAGDVRSCRDELRDRLQKLTGLPHFIPAVSGAGAVESALKMGLASQHPRNTILALGGGYGGKLLFSLTGTSDPSLRSGLDPLYPHAVFVDPFADDARDRILAAFREHQIAVVQIELVQGVGGVREIRPDVLQCLTDACRESDSLLFIDEIQTGMYRTGPFLRSTDIGIRPDLLTIGKGTSDMMFPFAVTMFSDRVQQRLDEVHCTVADAARTRFGYETGVRTMLNTLRRAEKENLADHVRRMSELFGKLLIERLKPCSIVRDVRCFGLLIGIELNTRRPVFGNLFAQLYLLAMTRYSAFPVLLGYCQYEPYVLKLTPPLSVTETEVRNICETIANVLGRSRGRVAAAGLTHAVLSDLKRMTCRT